MAAYYTHSVYTHMQCVVRVTSECELCAHTRARAPVSLTDQGHIEIAAGQSVRVPSKPGALRRAVRAAAGNDFCAGQVCARNEQTSKRTSERGGWRASEPLIFCVAS